MKNSIQLDSQSLIINGKREILIGGEFHYFRTPASLWEDRLKKIKQAGCNLITTYIPWNFHEEEEGKLVWTGDKDLPGFLRLCQKYELFVIIKPGPYICAEWDFGGFPHWLLEKDVPLRLPDKDYLDIVQTWYNEVAKVIKPYLVTNGGNIVLIQIENEYDHLIEEGEVPISKEEAKDYLLSLLRFVREAGIDIPAFTNEGSCILGTEIINTHTYYPNIPWIWMWEFNDFDRKIEISRKEQPDKPLMILELEAGWFAQFDQPLYDVETEVTDSIVKTVLSYGASVLNYYMVAGGTSFPYWSAKGDFGGIGICTTFDFGAAPVREWGEIHEKYHRLRQYSYFLNSFPEIIFEAKTSKQGVDFKKGGEDLVRIYSKDAKKIDSFQDSYENVKILLREHDKYNVLLVRNLEPKGKRVQVSFQSKLLKKEVVFPDKELNIPEYSTLLLPVDFSVNDQISILYATSEIVLKKKLAQTEYLFLKGSQNVKGEMVLCCDSDVEIIEGALDIKKDDKNQHIKIKYNHNQISHFQIDDCNIIILPEKEADKLWMNEHFILLSDFYYLNNVKEDKEKLELDFQLKNSDEKQRLIIWSDKEIEKITLDGKILDMEKKNQQQSELYYEFKQDKANQIEWSSKWHYCPDTEEKEKDHNDNNWEEIKADISLEKAKIFDHGYYWYRNEFTIPDGLDQVKLNLKTNEMDRLTVYINGQFRWIGIGSPDLDITDLVKPGKNSIAISYENAFHTKAHPHEGPIKKMSGLYCPVSVSCFKKGKEDKIEFKKWKLQNGLGGVNKEYYKEDHNDRSWISVPQAEKYIFTEECGNIIWLRRSFSFKKNKDWDMAMYIDIKECHDRCLIYVNGFLLGKYEQVGPQHKFYIPENLLKQENVLILVIEGPGFHPVKQFGFLPPKFTEPELSFFYEAKKVKVDMKLAKKEKVLV